MAGRLAVSLADLPTDVLAKICSEFLSPDDIAPLCCCSATCPALAQGIAQALFFGQGSSSHYVDYSWERLTHDLLWPAASPSAPATASSSAFRATTGSFILSRIVVSRACPWEIATPVPDLKNVPCGKATYTGVLVTISAKVVRQFEWELLTRPTSCFTVWEIPGKTRRQIERREKKLVPYRHYLHSPTKKHMVEKRFSHVLGVVMKVFVVTYPRLPLARLGGYGGSGSFLSCYCNFSLSSLPGRVVMKVLTLYSSFAFIFL